MTAVPAYVATDTYGIRWYVISCHRCPHLTGVQRQHGATLDACRTHDGRHAGRDAAGDGA